MLKINFVGSRFWTGFQAGGLSLLCSASISHYSRLGVDTNATKAEIKTAFLSLSKQHHPDLNPASKSEEAHKKFREISESYSVLIDPAKRSIYDQQLYGSSHPQFTSSATGADEERFGFYKYSPQANAYTYARAYRYYDFSDAQWEELDKTRTGGRSRRSHFKVLRVIVVLMLVGTFLHGVRIHYTHRHHQRKAERDSKRNQEVYEAVRERGRTSTLQQQLDRLGHTQRNAERDRKK